MASLPTIGGSDGTWGTTLNGFLEEEHASDGSHDIKWHGAKMYKSAAQTLSTTNETLVVMDADESDYYDMTDTTAGKIAPTKEGMYIVSGQVTFTDVPTGSQLRVDIKVSDTIVSTTLATVHVTSAALDTFSFPFCCATVSNGTDYFQVFATTTIANAKIQTGADYTYFQVYRIGVIPS